MIQTNRPNITPNLLISKLQDEIQEQQSIDISPTASLSSRLAHRQSKLEYINLILNDAFSMSQVRTNLPPKINRIPFFSNAKIQRILLKAYNFLFKEQRTINFGIIQAARENTSLNQQVSDQIINLENNQQRLNISIADRLTNLDDRLTNLADCLTNLDDRLTNLDDRSVHIETHLNQQITLLTARLNTAERTTQFIQKNYGDRLHYLQADLHQQKHLTAVLLSKEQDRYLGPETHTTQETTSLNSDIQLGLPSQKDCKIDFFYRAFEDKFRGDRSLIRERLQVYLPFLRESDLSQAGDEILDLGSGRGEWLELLRDEGYQGIGLDINQAMIQQCRELGLCVVEGDALIYLKSLSDNTLGAITGFHIVEHLPFESLIELTAEIYRVVRPKGLIIFETPNPRNVIVGSCTFYTDPTHKNPIPPEVLQFIVQYSCFETSQIVQLNPSQDPHVLEDSAMADRFNELFYGSMDYAVIGIKG